MPETPTPDVGPHKSGLLRERSLSARIAIIATILIPLAGVIFVPVVVWGWGFHWTDLYLLIAMYVLTVLGITVGFHRLFVHRSFETYTWLKLFWAVIGSMAVQGPLFRWVATHRRHHQHADAPGDPHSPQFSGGVGNLMRAFWHAHTGWLFDPEPTDAERYIKDLTGSSALRVVNRLFPLWVVLGLAIPALVGGFITSSWWGALTGFIWGGLVRVFLVHHVTWSVNSACHLWGLRPYQSNDDSRNNALFGILALGEGWHNTHHAFPTSARHGLRWWQIDVSYWVIRLMNVLGLAWNLKQPSLEAQAKGRRMA